MKKVSILIPVYNESMYIIRCLKNVIQSKINWKKEIIVIDDGSTDNTLNLVKEFSKKNKMKIISIPKNFGKGNAIKVGLKEATGEVVIIQDADLEYDPSDIGNILTLYNDSNIKVVYGSRILGKDIYHNYDASKLFLIGGLILTKCVNLIFKTNLTDQATGYKSWRNNLSKNLLKNCQTKGFEFEIEMTAYFSKITSIKETPIHYYPRTVNHGKKITLMDFIKSLWTVFTVKYQQVINFSFKE